MCFLGILPKVSLVKFNPNQVFFVFRSLKHKNDCKIAIKYTEYLFRIVLNVWSL